MTRMRLPSPWGRRQWSRGWLYGFVLAGLLLSSPGGAGSTAAAHLAVPASPVADGRTPLLAYYYIWFDPKSWDRAKRDDPVLGHYSSDSREVMVQHIRWAKAAGIDGFIVSWKNTEVLSRRLDLLIEVAAQEDFKLAIIYQGLDVKREPRPVEAIAADLDYFLERYGADEVFDLFGRPLVVWSGTWRYGREEIAEVTQPFRDRLFILASERSVGAYEHIADLVDGDAYYWSSVNPETYPGYREKLAAMGEVVHAHRGLWIAPAAPGFDARLVGGERVVDRKGGATLRQEYAAATASVPDAIGLISWNEFSENSHVEPSCNEGAEALAVLAELRGASAPTGLACPAATPTAVATTVAGATITPAIHDRKEDDAAPLEVATPLGPDEQAVADFDSSSPGGTTVRAYPLAVLGALAGTVLFCMAVSLRRARRQQTSRPGVRP